MIRSKNGMVISGNPRTQHSPNHNALSKPNEETYWYMQAPLMHWLQSTFVPPDVRPDDAPIMWKEVQQEGFPVISLHQAIQNVQSSADNHQPEMLYHSLLWKSFAPDPVPRLQYVPIPPVPVDKKSPKSVRLQNEALPNELPLYEHSVSAAQ